MTDNRQSGVISSGEARLSVPLTEKKVGMGEISVVRGAYLLRTLLGSCIGLAFYDPRRQIGGLAHIVLPAANGQTSTPGKYADTAVTELLRQMEQAGSKSRDITAKIAGGASMFETTAPTSIGELNLAAVEMLLRTREIVVLGRHCGGRTGRRMALNVMSGDVSIEIVGSPAMVI